jgi:hypothetical protein
VAVVETPPRSPKERRDDERNGCGIERNYACNRTISVLCLCSTIAISKESSILGGLGFSK